MKAIVLEQPGHMHLADVAEPLAPGRDQALVRVLRVGICGTDLHAYDGIQPFFSYPRILGHEMAVEVVALGPCDQDYDLAMGDCCAIEPYLDCGASLACRRGKPNCCLYLQVLGIHRDGEMREFLLIPANILHRANQPPLENIAIVEMFSKGAHAVRRAELEAGENVLVIGAGSVGLATMQFADVSGAKVIAMNINPARLDFCTRQLGIQSAVDAQHDAEQQLHELLSGGLPTAVFDATGSLRSMTNAFQFIAHTGRLIYVGLVRDDITFHDPHFHSREMTLLATRNATSADFAWVIDSFASGQVDACAWISQRVRPAELPQQFTRWLKPDAGVIKAVLAFDSE